MCARTEDIDGIFTEVSHETFRHLTAAGVAGADNKHALFHSFILMQIAVDGHPPLNSSDDRISPVTVSLLMGANPFFAK